MAASTNGMAQRDQGVFEWSVVGNSPIVCAVGCSVGASRVGAAVPRRQRAEHPLGVEVNEPRVIADEAADEGAAGEVAVIAVLERLHLARRELQLRSDPSIDIPAASRAARSSAPAVTDCASRASGARQRVTSVTRMSAGNAPWFRAESG